MVLRSGGKPRAETGPGKIFSPPRQAGMLPYVFAALAVNAAGSPGRIVGQPAMKPTVLAGPLATIVTALLLVAVPAANQNQQPPKWWNDPEYRRELGLTQEQSKKLEEIFQAAVPSQRTLKKTLDDAEAQFERLANQDKKAAAEQINHVVAARADLMKSHSVMLLDMRWVLTPDQWTRLGALQQQAEKQRALEKGK